jgi:hypothetical protein
MSKGIEFKAVKAECLMPCYIGNTVTVSPAHLREFTGFSRELRELEAVTGLLTGFSTRPPNKDQPASVVINMGEVDLVVFYGEYIHVKDEW